MHKIFSSKTEWPAADIQPLSCNRPSHFIETHNTPTRLLLASLAELPQRSVLTAASINY